MIILFIFHSSIRPVPIFPSGNRKSQIRNLKVPTHDRNESHQQQIKHRNRKQVFPLEIQQLINAQARKRPAKPHDYKNQKESFSKEPQRRRNVIHDIIECLPVADVKRHPSAEK